MDIRLLRQKLLARSRQFGPALAVTVLAGLAGYSALGRSDAATFAVTAEGEKGTIEAPAANRDDASASGGRAVVFQSGISAPDCTRTLASGADITAAVTGASPGDVICLAAGGTFSAFNLSASPGDSGRPVTLTSADRSNPATVRGRVVLKAGADWLNFSYLKFNAAGESLPSPTIGSENTGWYYNDVTNEHSGICFNLIDSGGEFGKAHDTVIDHNRIHDCGSLPAANLDHGIYVSGIGTRITNNYIYGNADRGIQLRGSQGAFVSHNIVDNNGEGITFGDLSASDNIVLNNIFSNAIIRWNVESYWGSAPVGNGNVFKDNCVWSTRSVYYGSNQSIDPGISGVTVTGVTFADPRYIDPSAGDYTLPVESPCYAYRPQP
jgi:parallel beta-helix repeat protein